RDLADVFCTTAEGVKGRRAVEWRLVDETVPRSRFDEAVRRHADELAGEAKAPPAAGVPLPPLAAVEDPGGVRYRHVELRIDAATPTARLVVRGPEEGAPAT